MNVYQLAYRNILRNRRRSTATLAAISLGAIAIILFGGFVIAILQGFSAGIIQRSGHLQIYKRGYFLYGAGNALEYSLYDYADLRKKINQDEVLKPMIQLVTPQLNIGGIAANFKNGTSKPFFGIGVLPDEHRQQRRWTPPGMPEIKTRPIMLDDKKPGVGSIGVGLARILGLCELVTGDCLQPINKSAGPITSEGQELAALATAEHSTANKEESDKNVINLLTTTVSGTPNAIFLKVIEGSNLGLRELNDSFITIHLSLAQRLVYGRGKPGITALVIQLNRNEDLEIAKTRIQKIISNEAIPLEVRDFKELAPQYGQILTLFAIIFSFIAALMGGLVLFSVANTMVMAVAERTTEIGTLRALGLKRGGVRSLFLTEGFLLGVIGATFGIVLALIISALINRAGWEWTPPGNANLVPLQIFSTYNLWLPFVTWSGLSILAVLSSWIPARRAAQLEVVDALRYV